MSKERVPPSQDTEPQKFTRRDFLHKGKRVAEKTVGVAAALSLAKLLEGCAGESGSLDLASCENPEDERFKRNIEIDMSDEGFNREYSERDKKNIEKAVEAALSHIPAVYKQPIDRLNLVYKLFELGEKLGSGGEDPYVTSKFPFVHTSKTQYTDAEHFVLENIFVLNNNTDLYLGMSHLAYGNTAYADRYDADTKVEGLDIEEGRMASSLLSGVALIERDSPFFAEFKDTFAVTTDFSFNFTDKPQEEVKKEVDAAVFFQRSILSPDHLKFLGLYNDEVKKNFAHNAKIKISGFTQLAELGKCSIFGTFSFMFLKVYFS